MRHISTVLEAIYSCILAPRKCYKSTRRHYKIDIVRQLRVEMLCSAFTVPILGTKLRPNSVTQLSLNYRTLSQLKVNKVNDNLHNTIQLVKLIKISWIQLYQWSMAEMIHKCSILVENSMQRSCDYTAQSIHIYRFWLDACCPLIFHLVHLDVARCIQVFILVSLYNETPCEISCQCFVNRSCSS